MKLIDLLVKELPKRGGWPEGMNYCGQSGFDNELYFYRHPYTGQACDKRGIFTDSHRSEYAYTPISREQYEAALASSEGWIEWAGGNCPVDSDAIVEVKYRWHNQHQYSNDRAGDFDWAHTGSSSDIIAYRLQKPGIDYRANDDRLEQDLNECIGQHVDMPEWNGDGVPPVGVECEFKCATGEWVEVEITATARKGVCFVERGKNGENYVSFRREFRPLRTEAEKAMESAKHIIAELCRESASNGHSADLIMEAIAEGKIPGVKLESK